MKTEHPLSKNLRKDRLPTVWCPGCGNGMVLSTFLKAVDELGLDMRNIAIVSGIGCSGRIGGYLKADSIHVTHGRALPVALGAKLVRPDLTLVAFMGDGDALSIGGNHLLHAARRNDDIKAIMINNMTFGMTGGQPSPTTPFIQDNVSLISSPGERPLDASMLCAVLGGSYVARWPTLNLIELKESIKTSLRTPGFCFVEVLSQCPIMLGKATSGDPFELMKWIKGKTIGIEEAEKVGSTGGKILIGEIVRPNERLSSKFAGLIGR